MSLQDNYYRTALQQIKRGNSKGSVSNAKIYFVLSVMDRMEHGTLTENKIMFDEASCKCYEQQCNLHSDIITPFVKPYFHLSSSVFYHIKWKDGITIRSYAKTPSSKFIKENAGYAYLDEALWNLLKEKNKRDEFRQLIIRTYLS